MARLEKKTSVAAETLLRLGAARLQEAEVLEKTGHPAGAIYLAGYAVECFLKARICKLLNVTHLPVTYHSHDLDALLLHAGLSSEMRSYEAVLDNFVKLCGVWRMDDPLSSIRYADPVPPTGSNARDFLRWVSDSETGVIPWLTKRLA